VDGSTARKPVWRTGEQSFQKEVRPAGTQRNTRSKKVEMYKLRMIIAILVVAAMLGSIVYGNILLSKLSVDNHNLSKACADLKNENKKTEVKIAVMMGQDDIRQKATEELGMIKASAGHEILVEVPDISKPLVKTGKASGAKENSTEAKEEKKAQPDENIGASENAVVSENAFVKALKDIGNQIAAVIGS